MDKTAFTNDYEPIDCRRCMEREAAYRVYSDIINIPVCPTCAEEARRLNIAVELMQ